MTRRSVDFPLPLGPSSAVSEPLDTSTETLSSAQKSPNCFVATYRQEAPCIEFSQARCALRCFPSP